MLASAHIDALQIHDTDGYALVEVSLSAPAPRLARSPRPGAWGAIDRTSLYPERSIQLVGEVWGATHAELYTRLDALTAAIGLPGASHVLRFLREGLAEEEQVTFVVGSDLDLPLAGAAAMIRWGVTLTCPDPRIYGVTLRSASYDPTSAGAGGLTQPLEQPLDYVGAAASLLTAANVGNAPTPPTYTIDGPVTNPLVVNETTGDTIYTQGASVVSGSTLVLDVGRRTALLAGAERPDLIDPLRTTWADLPPGTSLLRLSGTGMVGGETELTVTYRDARR